MEAARKAVGELSRGLLESDLTAEAAAEQMKDLRQALVRYIEVVSAGMAPEAAFNAVLAVQTQQMGADAVATQAASAATAGGIPFWLGMAAVIVLAAAALSPFIGLVGGATVVLTAFAVAGAGTLLLLGGLAAGFGAMAGVVSLLGVAGWGGANAAVGTPLAALIAQFNTFKQHLEESAKPIANLIFQFVGGLLPGIRQAGDALFQWFGDRLPGILSGISGIIKALTPDFEAFGKFLGQTFDKVFGQTSIGSGGTIRTLSESFQDMVRGMIGAAQGLITNLTNLSQWFLERLPAYGPVVSQIMSGIGSAVQGAAGAFGRFADWIVANWPSIMANVQAAVKSVGDEWGKWWPIVGPLVAQLLPALGDALKNISQHAGALVPVLLTVGILIFQAFLAILTVIGWIGQFLTWIDTFWNALVKMNNNIGVLNPFSPIITGLQTAIGLGEDLLGVMDRIAGHPGGRPSPHNPYGNGGGSSSTNYGLGGRSTNGRQRGFGGALE